MRTQSFASDGCGKCAFLGMHSVYASLCSDVCQPLAAPGRAKGRKKAAGAQALLQWDWDGQRGKIARSLAVMADIDLWKLYRPKPVEGGLLQTCSRTVSHTPTPPCTCPRLLQDPVRGDVELPPSAVRSIHAPHLH